MIHYNAGVHAVARKKGKKKKKKGKKGMKQFQKVQVKSVSQRRASVSRNDIHNVSLSLDDRVQIVFIQVRRAAFYITFMSFFTVLSLRGLFDNNVFYLGNAIRDQMEHAELNEEHAPTWGKSFDDVATVEELYQWLQVNNACDKCRRVTPVIG